MVSYIILVKPIPFNYNDNKNDKLEIKLNWPVFISKLECYYLTWKYNVSLEGNTLKLYKKYFFKFWRVLFNYYGRITLFNYPKSLIIMGGGVPYLRQW